MTQLTMFADDPPVLTKHVRCTRCGAIAPTDDLVGTDALLTLEDDEDDGFPTSCPQCLWSDTQWPTFALPGIRRLPGRLACYVGFVRHQRAKK